MGATLDLKLADGTNDAEEHLAAAMDVGSTDLEIPYEDSGTPSRHRRAAHLPAVHRPAGQGRKISKAYVEFTCDETKDGTKPVNLIIEGQLALNPPAFTTAAKNLTGRAPGPPRRSSGPWRTGRR